MRMAPVVFEWREVDVSDLKTGVVESTRAMVPTLRYRKVADRQFSGDQEYPLIPLESRSRASHSHYFAAINEAFDNLPEAFCAERRWTSADDMRKDILIEIGGDFAEERIIDCASKRHADMLAAYIRDETGFCKISFLRDDNGKPTRVRIRRAKSQDMASMDKHTFEASKKAVLEILEGIIGLARGDLMKHAGRGA